MKMHKLPFKFLIFTLIFAVLAFGMRATWSRFVVETLLYLALGGFLVQAWKGEKTLYSLPGLIPLGLVLLLMILQIIPLPMAWIAKLSPAAADLYRETVVITGGLEKATLSITPDLTQVELFRFAALIVVYYLSVQLLADRKTLKWCVTFAAIFATGVALFGIVQHFTSGGKLYWFREMAGSHFGPFVYRNHFAGFMVLLFPISFGLFYLYKPQIRYGSFRESLLDCLTGREVNLRVLYGLSALVVATSVFVCLSRGGVSALCFSALFLSLMLLVQKGGSKKGLAVAIFISLVVLSVSWFGWDAIVERFANSVNDEGEFWDGRFIYWADTKRIISDFSWVGSGFGTFVTVYPAYQSIFLHGMMVSHAHGDYFELFATGGLVGFFLFAWFAGELVLRTVGVYRKRRERYSRYIYLASGAGLLGFMAQSLAEFNFYSGAAVLWFYFVAALWVSAAHTRLRGRAATRLSAVSQPKAMIVCVGVAVAVGLGVSVTHNVSRLGAEYAFSKSLDAEREGADAQAVLSFVQTAVEKNPLNPRYHLDLAALLAQQGDVEASRRHFARAAALNPASAELFHLFARYAGNLDRNTISYCLEQARDREVMNPNRYKFSASSLFVEGRKEEAVLTLVHAMELDPSKENIDECLKIMIYSGVSFEEIATLIPPTPEAALAASEFFEAFGEDDLSVTMLDTACDTLISSPHKSLGLYFRIYSRLMKNDDVNRALAVIQAAARTHPDNERVYVLTGDIYTQMGIGYRARDEYRKALAINPRNPHVLKKFNGAGGTL
ncbi:hypothetical protein DSLASN_12320 [Desulfoluna limicola]|uniref:O-antigen ligase-related domain-containing protein n=1 Tax=Desulfoluna limicola TaxID=2810562 RepID=A0ABM7PDJ0_9BACT|nr:O-antigen ligase family protein [Desulfoluna limicola]BCS95600.1 hypothetical protein DSLASN_12320 [Desulfoluna limicola]